MPLSVLSKKTFPLIAFFVAATALVPARAENALVKEINSAEELRKVLSATTPESTETGVTAAYDGYTLKVVPSKLTIPLTPGVASSDNPMGTLIPVADRISVLGNGSMVTLLQTDGIGDFLGLDRLSYNFGNFTISGAGTNPNDADGRFAILAAAQITVGGDTVFSDRFFSANASTLSGSAGGIFYSTEQADRIVLDASSGKIEFDSITAYGDTIEIPGENNTTKTSENSAAGGVVFLTGTLTISGKNVVDFSSNKTESKDADAWGGAIYATSSAENLTDYGLKFNAGTQVNFAKNSAVGENAQGGAILLVGSAFSGKGTRVAFSGNTTSANGASGVAVGGALVLGSSATANFDADSALSFLANRAEASGDFSLAAGGAVYLSDSTLSIAAKSAEFSGNSVMNSGDGGMSLGGAFAISGENASVEFSASTGGSNLLFSKNSVSVSGTAKDENVTNDGSVSVVNRVPEAQGGALAITGGKLNFSYAGTTAFSENSVNSSLAGTIASGGALAISGAATEVVFNVGSAKFSSNSAISGESGTARGGAIFQLAGTLKTQVSSNFVFSGNRAGGQTTGDGITQALGGAIAQLGGVQTYVSTNDQQIEFSGNSAAVSGEASGSSAFGGAIALAQRDAELTFDAKTVLFGNSAEATSTGVYSENSALTSAMGGAIYSAGTLVLSEANFAGNNAKTFADFGVADGGAVYIARETVRAEKLSFSENKSQAFDAAGARVSGMARGGALYLSTGSLSTSGSVFSANEAVGETARGGAAYLGGFYCVDDSLSWINNKASGTQEASGGGAYVTGNLATSGAGATTFSGNVATASAENGVALGGAIYATGTLNFSGTGTTTFSGNSATASGAKGIAFGGAIYAKGGAHRFDNVTFSGNSATGTLAAGGAIYIDASGRAPTELTLSGNTTISGNTANGENSGIAVGNGMSGTDAISQDVTLKIAPNGTFSESVDENGNTVSVRDSFETVTLDDAISVELNGADFMLEKTADGGDLNWSGATAIAVKASTDADGESIGGNFKFAFRSGTTTFKSGFSMTGTPASVVEIDEAASVKIESGATFCNFKSMTLNGTLNVSGTLNFDDSSVVIGNTGALIFENSTSNLSGTNKISGILTTHGNANFTANTSGTSTKISLATDWLFVEKSGEVAFTGLSVLAEHIAFDESGILNLGEGTTLSVKTLNAINPEASLSVKITGTGTLVLLDETTQKSDESTGITEIVFNAYMNSETKEFVASDFSIAEGVKIKSGILINPETSLLLGSGTYKNVIIDGGTLSANTESGTLNLDSLEIKSSAKIGDGKTTQTIILKSGTDDEGKSIASKIALEGNLEIRENATLVTDATLKNYSSAGLIGAGTLKGNVSGSGQISLSKIDGNASFVANQRTAFSGASEITGNVVNSGTMTLRKNAVLSVGGVFTNEASGRLVFESGTRFSGEMANAGTLTISGNAVLEKGTIFAQSEAGALVIESGASLNCQYAEALSLAGTLVIDPADLIAGEEFTSLFGLKEGELSAMKITDASANPLTDRVIWDDSIGSYVFLGLNGREIATTLYGDFARENIFRLYDFMRAGLMHTSVSSINPPLFGEKKETSRYMQKYLERKNRFNQSDDKPSVPEAVSESKPGDFGRAANALMNRVWIQAQYSHTSAGKSGENLDYDVNGWGALIGSSLPTSETGELGIVFGYNHSRMKHTGTHMHKIDSDAYELMGFARKKGETYDGVFALSGAYATNDSERGSSEADFNAWQVGFMLEGGVTFRPEAWCEIRPYLGLQGAYTRTDSFTEKGGEDALSLDASDAFAARGTLGIGVGFLATDSVQLSFRMAWNLDLGNRVFETDAYQDSTLSEVELSSREGERSSFDLGAYVNFRMSDNVSFYTGYTGTLRSGYEEHRANLGLNIAF